MNELQRRFSHFLVGVLLAAGMVLLVGSIHPDRRRVEKTVDPAERVVVGLQKEIPLAHQSAWDRAVQREPLRMLRYMTALSD